MERLGYLSLLLITLVAVAVGSTLWIVVFTSPFFFGGPIIASFWTFAACEAHRKYQETLPW